MTKKKSTGVTTERDMSWLKEMNSKFKNSKMHRYGDGEVSGSWEKFSTGSLTLDIATNGGWVYGGMNYITGWESSGKTTLMLHAIKSIQEQGHYCAFIDFENTFDADYAESLGVNVEDLFLAQPESMEDGLEMIREIVKNTEKNGIRGVVLDSVAAGIMKSELEEEVDKASMATKARLSSKVLPQISMYCKKNNVAFLVTNQKREKIGGYGSAETENGGVAWRFYQVVAVDLRRSIAKDKLEYDEDGIPVSNPVSATVRKNKAGSPFRVGQFEIEYGNGIDQVDEMVTIGIDNDWIKKGGAWFTIFNPNTGEEVHKVQGRSNAKKALREDTELYAEMYEIVTQSLK